MGDSPIQPYRVPCEDPIASCKLDKQERKMDQEMLELLIFATANMVGALWHTVHDPQRPLKVCICRSENSATHRKSLEGIER